MARNGKSLFEEASDSDSVPTDWTAESEAQEEYIVDHVLAEDSDYEGTGETRYLLKWQAYPIARATWEPPENITDDKLLEDWETKKRKVRNGEAIEYDVNEYYNALARFEAETEERHRRRKIKRRKKGLPIKPSGSESDDDFGDDPPVEEPASPRRSVSRRAVELESGDEDVIAAGRRTPRKKAKVTTVKRKGVARRVGTGKSALESSSSEEEEIERKMAPSLLTVAGDSTLPRDSDLDSLFDASGSQPIYPDLVLPPKKLTAVLKSKPTIVTKLKPTSGETLRTKTTGPPRKSAPSTSTAVKSKKQNIFASWDDPSKKRRQRPRVSDQTPKDATDPKFSNLATQNRFQKYSRNEPAPNPDQLVIVDPKTGSSAPPKAASTTALRDVHNAYLRRTPPPPDPQPRSVTPPAPPMQASAPVQIGTSAQQGSLLPSNWRTVVCHYWMSGEACRYGADRCPYAHWPVEPKKQLPAATMPRNPLDQSGTTCYWMWKRRYCDRENNGCPFAHYDTGIKSKMQLRDEANGLGPDVLPPNQSSSGAESGPHIKTCSFWRRGVCKWTPAECKFAHYETGITAKTPLEREQERSLAEVIHTMSAAAQRYQTGQGPPEQVDMGSTVMPDTVGPDNFAAPPPPSAVIPPQVQDPRLNKSTREADSGTRSASLRISSDGGADSTDLQVDLHMTGISAFDQLFRPVSKGVYLTLDHTVSAGDMQTYCKDLLKAAYMPAGAIVPRDNESSQSADKLADFCKLRVSALAWKYDRFTLLVYPSTIEEWKFLDTPGATAPSTTSLRFTMLPPLQDTSRSNATSKIEFPPYQAPARTVGDFILDLEPEMFWTGSDEGVKRGERSVYIAIPDDRQLELDMLIKYFEARKSIVYHSGTPGAWDFFRQKRRKGEKGLVLIIHPEVRVWEIPHLHEFVAESSSAVLSLGLHRASATSMEYHASCHFLFPHRTAILITDDVIAYHPDKATRIIENRLNSKKPKELQLKVVARWGVRDWIQRLILGNTDVDRIKSWFNLHSALNRLCTIDDYDPFDPSTLLSSSDLVALPADGLPEDQDLWEQGNGKVATDLMVERFAGWAIENVDTFRRFYVCYESRPDEGRLNVDGHGRMVYQKDSDPRGWSKRYPHIGVKRQEDIPK